LHLQQLQWLFEEFGLAHLIVEVDLVANTKQIRIQDFINHSKPQENSWKNIAKLTTSTQFPSRETRYQFP